MSQTKHEIQALLAAANTEPRHRFGQNFMIDQNLVRLVADAGEIESNDIVIEVGPGTGTLTEELLGRAARVIAVDGTAPPVYTISGTPTAAEGGSLTFTVNRTSTGTAETVNFTLGGTATAGSDYTDPVHSVSFAAGDTSKTITINTLTDAIVEPELQAGGKQLDVEAFLTFARGAKHQGRARRLALEVVEQVRPGTTKRLLKGWLTDPEFGPDHALGIVDLAGRIESERGRKRMKNRSSGLEVGMRRGLKHPLDVVLGHSLAAQRNLGAATARGEAPAGHVDDDASDLDARHAFGCVDREPRGVFRRLQIDHCAALDPDRALVADAEHLAAVGAPA